MSADFWVFVRDMKVAWGSFFIGGQYMIWCGNWNLKRNLLNKYSVLTTGLPEITKNAEYLFAYS